MLDIFLQPASWAAIATLTLLEIVLGVDNIVFIAILAGRLPKEQQPSAQRLGLAAALVTRLLLLFAISWITRLERPLFELLGHGFSGRSIILLAGGLFLLVKAVREIYAKTELLDDHAPAAKAVAGLGAVVVQIALMDIIFSLDSIITAVGMVKQLPLMVTAIVIAMAVMVVFASKVGAFVNDHPSIKILALSFLLLIGVLLVAEGTGYELPRGYVYFAMAFALVVDLLQMRYEANVRRKRAELPG
ncbi:MAG TPA: TerC family protein [Coriobacteriia bacterium]